MIQPKKTILATGLALSLLLAACGSSGSDEASDATAQTTTTTTASVDATTTGGPGGGMTGGPGGVDVDSVETEEELVTLIQEAYGDGSLDLHRGHQPVQDVLDEVLAISHEELHVYMEEQDMNLAAVATELDIDPQTLIEALVDAWSPAIDNAVAAGAITEDEAEQYLDDLTEAFTFRVTWDGVEAEPTYAGLDA